MKKLLLLFIFFIALQFDIHSQTEIDTLHQFPDTTQFYPYANGPWTNDMANLAVKILLPDSINYKITSLMILLANNIDTMHHSLTRIRVSVGDYPEQKILTEKYFQFSIYYPYWQLIDFDSSAILNGCKYFYVSGAPLFFMSTSSVSDSMYSDNFRYNWWIEKWQEGTYILFPIKAIVEKNVSGIGDNDLKNVPIQFKLYQNYPNPFNPSTTIRYSIPTTGFVTLKVFNVLGREVAELVKSEQRAGTYEVSFKAKHLPSGVYLYHLQSGNYTTEKKMILLK